MTQTTCEATMTIHQPRLGASFPERTIEVRCRKDSDHIGEHYGRTDGHRGVAWSTPSQEQVV